MSGCIKPPQLVNSGSHTAAGFISSVQKNRREQKLCDVFVETSDGLIVPAHSLVLSYSSTYLRNLIEKSKKELECRRRACEYADRLTIRVDIKCNVFTECLNFMYWEKPEPTMETVEGILTASEKLNIPKLLSCCSKFLEKKITMSTCAVILDLSQKYKGISELKQSCCEFLRKEITMSNYVDILDLSQKYAITSMLDWSCCKFLEKKITMENCADMLDLSQKYPSMSRLAQSCCEFLEKEISMSTCADIMELSRKYARLARISWLGKSCCNFWGKNLTVENCLDVIERSREYKKIDLQEIAEKFVINNLRAVSETSRFLQVQKADLVRYIESSNVGGDVIWKILSVWIPRNGSDICGRILKEMVPQQARNADLSNYMLKHFDDLVKQNLFLLLDKEDISFMLFSPDLVCSSEDFKLKALLDWTHRQRDPIFRRLISGRTNHFDELFKSIKPRSLSRKFKVALLKNEPMIKDNEKQRVLLLDSLAESDQETLPNTSRDQTSILHHREPWRSLSMAAELPSPPSVRSRTASETSNSTISSFKTASSLPNSEECEDFYETSRFRSLKKY